MPFLFRKKPTPCPRCGLTYCTGNYCAPTPEPFDARAWLERCCERLKTHYNERTPIYAQLYCKTREAGGMIPSTLFARVSNKEHAIDQAQLVRLFRACRTEYVGE